jgi:hypothetical protein
MEETSLAENEHQISTRGDKQTTGYCESFTRGCIYMGCLHGITWVNYNHTGKSLVLPWILEKIHLLILLLITLISIICFHSQLRSVNSINNEKKVKTVMVNNSTNINKMNNHLWPQVIEHKKHHNIWNWKSRSWFETGTNMWQG